MAAEDAPHVLADEVGPHPPPLHELVADIAVDHAVLVPRRRRRPQRITREVGCSINGITTYFEGLAWTWLNSGLYVGCVKLFTIARGARRLNSRNLASILRPQLTRP